MIIILLLFPLAITAQKNYPSRFFYADNSDRFNEFEIDKAGKMTKAWFIGNADKVEMKKL